MHMLAENTVERNHEWLFETFAVIGIAVSIIAAVIAVVWLTCFVVKLLIKTFGEKVQAYKESSGSYTTAWNKLDETLITTPSIPSTVKPINSELSFKEITSDGKTEYVIYIPEYKNLDVTTPATISLSIKQGEFDVKDQHGNNYKLHFADYSDGKSPNAPQWDIIRNDIYDYTITKIESGLQVKLKVAPWVEYKHSGVVM